MKSFREWFELQEQAQANPQIRQQLTQWVNQDESMSQQWISYMQRVKNKLEKQGLNPEDVKAKYQDVAKNWWYQEHPQLQDKSDPFGRLSFQPQAAKFIQDHAREIFADTGANWNNPSALLLAWHLAQHMDHPKMKAFQRWFFNEMRKQGVNQTQHPNYRNFQFLSDRSSVNMGQRQKYGTQGDRGLYGHVNPT